MYIRNGGAVFYVYRWYACRERAQIVYITRIFEVYNGKKDYIVRIFNINNGKMGIH